MKAVAIKELKNRLGEYLREVRGGEVVLVTDRGRVIAELRQPGSSTPLRRTCSRRLRLNAGQLGLRVDLALA